MSSAGHYADFRRELELEHRQNDFTEQDRAGSRSQHNARILPAVADRDGAMQHRIDTLEADLKYFRRRTQELADERANLAHTVNDLRAERTRLKRNLRAAQETIVRLARMV